MPVITISRQLGSLGTEIAQQLCNGLQCKCLDKESLEEVFGEFGIPKESIERFDEKKPGFWDLFKTDKIRYLHYMKSAILEFAQKGSGIILGRGGQILLQELTGILHIRIIAPANLRINRIIKRLGCEEPEAEQIVQHSDRERAGFHRFFYGEDWENPNLYNMVLNTGIISASTAAQLVENLLNSPEFKDKQVETSHKLSDLCLEHEVKTAILFKENILIQFLEVNANHGIVTIRGIVDNPEDLNICDQLLKQLPNIKELHNQLYYSPLTAAYGIHY